MFERAQDHHMKIASFAFRTLKRWLLRMPAGIGIQSINLGDTGKGGLYDVRCVN